MPTYTGFAKGGNVTRVTERELARSFYAAGATGCVFRPQDFLVTAANGSRRVTVALGTLSACGVVATHDTAADLGVLEVPQPPKDQGQNFLLVARFDWYQRLVTFEWLPSTTTSPFTQDTLPARPPLALPTMRRTPGDYFDVPLAWVWASYGFVSLRVVNLRVLPGGFPVEAVGALTKGRTAQNTIPAGTAGEVAGGDWGDQPRGVYQVAGTLVLGTTDAGTTTGGEIALIVNGQEAARPRADQSYSARPASTSVTIDHPGGRLSVSGQFRGGTQPVLALPTSTVSARWVRPLI